MYKRKEIIGDCTLYLGDCLEVMPTLENVNCVFVDPPYNAIVKNDWDNQWESMQCFQNWCNELAKIIQKITTDNMCFFWFGDDKNIAYSQVIFDRYFNLLNSLVWEKKSHVLMKGVMSLRSFGSITERALFYDKGDMMSGLEGIHSNAGCFKSIKIYMRAEKQKIKDSKGFKTEKEFNEYINKVTDTSSVVSNHYFADSQYSFPTPELYKKLQTTGFFKREYEDLRREYEDLRREYEDLRRPWKACNKSFDVFKWNTCQDEGRIHPTQKPLSMVVWLLEKMTRPSDTVLDFTMGSGTTLVACAKMGRKGIGIELDEEYFNIACKRVEQAYKQPDLLGY